MTAPVYLLIRRPWRYKEKREIFLGLFVVYFVSLIALVFEGNYSSISSMLERGIERLHTMDYINFIPFRTIKLFFSGNVSKEGFWINIISNVVIFIPWGFGLTMLWKVNQKRLYLPFIYSLLLPVFIEIFQLFIGRNTDIDDVILNFLGGAIGIIGFTALKKRFKFLKEFAK